MHFASPEYSDIVAARIGVPLNTSKTDFTMAYQAVEEPMPAMNILITGADC
jgi:hypothetical protein